MVRMYKIPLHLKWKAQAHDYSFWLWSYFGIPQKLPIIQVPWCSCQKRCIAIRTEYDNVLYYSKYQYVTLTACIRGFPCFSFSILLMWQKKKNSESLTKISNLVTFECQPEKNIVQGIYSYHLTLIVISKQLGVLLVSCSK